jgi:light-regulated signal transduction histidine kinase (bacteriophytochrome)
MQTLYGIKITDRVTVQPFLPKGFAGFFDGEQVTEVVSTGERAVRLAQQWLQQRAEQRKWEEKWAAETEVRMQKESDDLFLVYLAEKLGISNGDMERLLEIIKRRMS